jgi:hypothetical protein
MVNTLKKDKLLHMQLLSYLFSDRYGKETLETSQQTFVELVQLVDIVQHNIQIGLGNNILILQRLDVNLVYQKYKICQ